MSVTKSELEEYERLYRYAKDPYSVYDNVDDDSGIDLDVETVPEEKAISTISISKYSCGYDEEGDFDEEVELDAVVETKTTTEKSNSKHNEFIKVAKNETPAERYVCIQKFFIHFQLTLYLNHFIGTNGKDDTSRRSIVLFTHRPKRWSELV